MINNQKTNKMSWIKQTLLIDKETGKKQIFANDYQAKDFIKSQDKNIKNYIFDFEYVWN